MANDDNHGDWLQFYNNQNLFTTTFTAAASPAATISPGGDGRLSADSGRVSKPARRRSRASRRTPTTLFSTDTANFRAMVQQFTGCPSATAFGSGSDPSLTSSSRSPGGIVGGLNHQHVRPYVFSLGNVNPFGHNMNTNANVVGSFDMAAQGGFASAEMGGAGGGSAPSEVSGSRNNPTSWLQ